MPWIESCPAVTWIVIQELAAVPCSLSTGPSQ